jgi:hypothetical protein
VMKEVARVRKYSKPEVKKVTFGTVLMAVA